jgi:hypothetical protein
MTGGRGTVPATAALDANAERGTSMSGRLRLSSLAVCLLTASITLPVLTYAQAQGRGSGRGQAEPRDPAPVVTVRGHVFIGGYFYDPFFGPYPWWPRRAYPHWYRPVFDSRAEVRVLVTPREAGVYVDGFYAGVVDDFDGFFQRLPLPPGGHEIVLYLQGYRTEHHRLYLGPGATASVRDVLVRLPEGVTSEPPDLAPPVPPPPAGTFRQPRIPPRPTPPSPPWPPAYELAYGTIQLRVQPTGAEVRIDGLRWVSSDGQHFVVDLPAGRHRVDVFLEGYQRFSDVVPIREGETLRLNVSLAKGGA